MRVGGETGQEEHESGRGKSVGVETGQEEHESGRGNRTGREWEGNSAG